MQTLRFLLFSCTIGGIFTNTSHLNNDIKNEEDMIFLEDEESANFLSHDQRHKAFYEQCLKSHNLLRARHMNTPPLKWNAALARESKIYANKLRDVVGKLVHSKVNGQGENLYYKMASQKATCADAVQAWYDEIKNYNFRTGKSSNGGVIGHFTQIVSTRSRSFGAAIATKRTKVGNNKYMYTTYIVAKYAPHGNINGQNTRYVMRVKTGAPMPTLQPPPPCKDVDSATKCKWLANSVQYGPCTNTKWRSYYETNCRKFCKFCK